MAPRIGEDPVDQTDDDGKPARRRGKSRRPGFRPAAAVARSQAGTALSKRGFAEPDVLLHWPEIVGADLAPACRPVRIAYGRGPAVGATLIVEADGARATEITHLAPRILEKVNSFCGFRAVSRLKLTQTGQRGFAETGARFEGPGEDAEMPGPDHASTAEAERLAARVEDPTLRATLARLGAHVLARAKARPT